MTQFPNEETQVKIALVPTKHNELSGPCKISSTRCAPKQKLQNNLLVIVLSKVEKETCVFRVTRERQTDIHRHRHRQTETDRDRDTYRQTHTDQTQTDRQKQKHRQTKTKTHRDRARQRQTDK